LHQFQMIFCYKYIQISIKKGIYGKKKWS
jgi:hypothetical protein